MKKLLVALAVAGLVLATSTGVASSQTQYPPADNAATISDPTPNAGQTVQVTARCFVGSVTIRLGTTVLATATADASGEVSVSVTIPADVAAGTAAITVSGTSCAGAAQTVQVAVQVAAASVLGATETRTPAAVAPAVAAQVPGGTGLARTGDDSGLTALTGALVVGAGAALVLSAAGLRRRSARRA